MSSPNLRQISRDKLFAVFKNQELVLLFEEILYTLNETLPGDTTAVELALTAHIADTVDAHQASAIGATPGGSRASNTVQGQLGDLDSSKQPVDALLTAIAALVTVADQLIYTTGTDTVAVTPLSLYVRDLLDDPDAATARATLALGSIATQDANNVAITGGTVTTGTGAVGYSTGNGGTVTQATSKSTSVTLDERFGEITMDAANLVAGTSVGFTFTNSTIAAEDYLHIRQVAGTQHAYSLAWAEFNGGATINVKNVTGGDLAEPIVLRFYVFKGALS